MFDAEWKIQICICLMKKPVLRLVTTHEGFDMRWMYFWHKFHDDMKILYFYQMRPRCIRLNWFHGLRKWWKSWITQFWSTRVPGYNISKKIAINVMIQVQVVFKLDHNFAKIRSFRAKIRSIRSYFYEESTEKIRNLMSGDCACCSNYCVERKKFFALK